MVRGEGVQSPAGGRTRRGVSWALVLEQSTRAAAPPPSVLPGPSWAPSFMGLRATPGSLPCWASVLPAPRTGLCAMSSPSRVHGPAPGLTAGAHTHKLTSDSRAGAWSPEPGWTLGEGVDTSPGSCCGSSH